MRRTTLCYIERGGAYLMLHRTKKENDANHDKWLGVGGGIESGEAPDECLLREVREETGLTLKSYRGRGVIDFVSDRWEDEEMHLYTAAIGDEAEPRACDEGDLEWVLKEKIESLPIWEGDKIFLELLRRDAPYFRLRLEYRGETLARAVLNGEELKL